MFGLVGRRRLMGMGLGAGLVQSVPWLAEACVTGGSGGSSAPAPAAAAGYNTQTFGPSITLGTTNNPTTNLPTYNSPAGANWYPFTYFGIAWKNIGVVANSDGSVTMSGAGQSFNAGLSSTILGSNATNWLGVAFGGGGYFEATLSFTGQSYGADTPAWWSNDVENMNSLSTTGNPIQWPGQAAGYGHWVEPDFAEWDASAALQYGFGIHDWYGTVGSGNGTSSTNSGSPTSVPSGTLFTQSHKYGFLWIPATATTQGSASYYFDGAKVGNTLTWNQYNASLSPPPVLGTSAFSVLDTRHLSLILGNGTGTPLTVYGVSVWQNSNSGNLYQSG